MFGSWAKGRARKDSDIDLCIVSSRFNSTDSWEYLWPKRVELKEYLIEPVGYSPENFIDENPLAWEIKNTGIKVK